MGQMKQTKSTHFRDSASEPAQINTCVANKISFLVAVVTVCSSENYLYEQLFIAHKNLVDYLYNFCSHFVHTYFIIISTIGQSEQRQITPWKCHQWKIHSIYA